MDAGGFDCCPVRSGRALRAEHVAMLLALKILPWPHHAIACGGTFETSRSKHERTGISLTPVTH